MIAWLGAGLVINGVGLFLTARAAEPSRIAVRLFSIGDLLWVVATVALIVSGVWIEQSAGIFAALAVAAFVGAMGWLQWRALSQDPGGDRAAKPKLL